MLRIHRYYNGGGSIYIFYSIVKKNLEQYNLKILRTEDKSYQGNWETKKGDPTLFFLKKIN
jgi:hypothetical protein